MAKALAFALFFVAVVAADVGPAVDNQALLDFVLRHDDQLAILTAKVDALLKGQHGDQAKQREIDALAARVAELEGTTGGHPFSKEAPFGDALSGTAEGRRLDGGSACGGVANTRLDSCALQTGAINVHTINITGVLNVEGRAYFQGNPWGPREPTPVPTPAPTPVPLSCREYLDQGYTASGTYAIRLQSSGSTLGVYCDMDTAGGGWTLMEKTVEGSAALLESGGNAIDQASLRSAGVENIAVARCSDADIKAILSGGGMVLWKYLGVGYKVVYYDGDFVDSWSSDYMFNEVPRNWFEIYIVPQSKWYSINGHYNHGHWSVYHDGDAYSGYPAWGGEYSDSSQLPSTMWPTAPEYPPDSENTQNTLYRFNVANNGGLAMGNFEFYFQQAPTRPVDGFF